MSGIFFTFGIKNFFFSTKEKGRVIRIDEIRTVGFYNRAVKRLPIAMNF